MNNYAEGVDLQDLERLIPSPTITKQQLLLIRKEVSQVVVRPEVMRYMQQIIMQTRDPVYVQLGGSTRAAVVMLKAARSLAAVRGVPFVSPDEVKEVVLPVLRHRLILRPEALIDGLTPDYFLQTIMQNVPVPR
jgi:MoxR-like ATPase